MTDYAKIELSARYSASSDYSSPDWTTSTWLPFELTPDEGAQFKVEAATSSGTTVTTSIYSSVTLVAVQNIDPTNYVTATFRTAGNSTTDNIIRIAADGGILVVSDFTAANNLVLAADTAVCTCRVLIVGT